MFISRFKDKTKAVLINMLSPRQLKSFRRILLPGSVKRFYRKWGMRLKKPLTLSRLNNVMKRNLHPVDRLKKIKLKNIDRLKKEYFDKKLDQLEDSFILYRIIGNDLYPRHQKGQSRKNLEFILNNEPELEKCTKIFIVNRIIDRNEEKEIINILDNSGYGYIKIPFIPEDYLRIEPDTNCFPEAGYLASEDFESLKPDQQARAIASTYRLKNNYVMNNNGARNFALQNGKKKAKWVLPWDGNCFITAAGWKEIKSAVIDKPYLKYFAVPMVRVFNNDDLLSEDYSFDPVEEPQLIFRKDTLELFNEEYSYGRRPKVELFWRLGIPGKWDSWEDEPWDLKRPRISDEARQFGVAGWVARLFSGMESLEQHNLKSFRERGVARVESIISTLQNLDAELSGMSPEDLNIIDRRVLEKELEVYRDVDSSPMKKIADALIRDAEEALLRGPYSVIDKTTLPPSGDTRDYFHPSPYWWPNPKKSDGLPYIYRDGERVPGTRMYESESDKYDRTRLQRVFDDSTILALAWKFTGEKKYVQHGAKILKRFFVDPDTKMNPHMKYSQVIMGRNNNMGVNYGIIEMKDIYYYLDAIRIMIDSGEIPDGHIESFKNWVSSYLEWLVNSPQGTKERKATNNHGTFYDLQVAALASFIGEESLLYETVIRAQSRIGQQFTSSGLQPREIERKTTAHYCCFNIQGWLNLAELASRWGVDLWTYEAKNGATLVKGMMWLLNFTGKEWPYRQINEFDDDRFLYIWHSIPEKLVGIISGEGIKGSMYEVKPVFFPHDGIRPYWNLGHRNSTII